MLDSIFVTYKRSFLIFLYQNNGALQDKILGVFSCSPKHVNSSSVTVSVLCYCFDSADLPFGANTQFYIADLPFFSWGEGVGKIRGGGDRRSKKNGKIHHKNNGKSTHPPEKLQILTVTQNSN